MSEAAGYEHDIFISYTHNDNAPIGAAPGWVDVFHESLANWLIKRRGLRNLAIWRDERRMDGNTRFNAAIENALKSSALFFALVSRNYLNSEYCKKELNWFRQAHDRGPGGLTAGEHSRMFPILLNNIPHADWPEDLGGTAGFDMHDADDRELGDFTPPDDDCFNKQLRKIVDAVERTLAAFPKQESAPAGAEPAAEAVKIFVADASEGLEIFRDRVITEIQDAGAEILDEIPPPMPHADHAAAVDAALAGARLSVHLLDQGAGRRIRDLKETTYPRAQLEIALRAAAPKLIWTPPADEIARIADEAQRAFLQDLAARDRGVDEFELVSGTQSEFIHVLRRKIETLQAPAASGGPDQACLLDTHQKDQRFAFKLADYLCDQGVNVEFNQESHDPSASLSLFEQHLRQVRHLIIVSGKVEPSWLNGRIKKAFKVIGEQWSAEDVVALEHIWVYQFPGGDAAMPAFPPLIKVNILDNRHAERIDPAVAGELLGAVSAAGGLA